MYMENNKIIYLETLKSKSGAKLANYETVKKLFELVEPEESKLQMDICNINPNRYGYILIKSMSNASYKFTDFYKKMNILLKYRNFCWVKGLIDPEKFYENNSKDCNYLNDLRSLYLVFRKLVLEERNNAQIETPMKLYNLLHNELYSQIDNYNYLTQHDEEIYKNTISYEDIVILYLMLFYHGLNNEQISELKFENVLSITKNQARILFNNKIYVLNGEFCTILEKRLNVEIVDKRGYFYDLHKEYLFAFESDKTKSEIKKRIELLYFKYDRDKNKITNLRFPTNKEIRFNGILYQMCINSKGHRKMSTRETIDLYNAMSGENVKNKAFVIEIEEMYQERFDYLKNNGWPQ